MPDAPHQSRKTKGHTRLMSGQWLAVAGILILVGLAICFTIVQDYDAAMARERDRLQTHTHVVDDNLVQHFQGINAALINVRNDAGGLARGDQGQAISNRLMAMSDAMPGVRTMLAIDAKGIVVAASRPEFMGVDLSTRTYFQRARAHPDPNTLFVSEPFTTIQKVFSVNLTKVWLDSNGKFGGIVTATLDPKHFEVLLRSVLYATGVRSTLIHDNGQVFVQMPRGSAPEKLAGENSLSFFARHHASGQSEGFFVGPIFTTSEDHMVAYRSINAADLHLDASLVTSISRPKADVLATWGRTSITLVALYAVIVAMALMAFKFLQDKQRALDAARLAREQETIEQSQRLQMALAGGDIGFWEVDLLSGKRIVDARTQGMVGLTGDDPPDDIGKWGDRIHANDKAGWVSARDAHIAGESESFVYDYRVRHEDGHWVWIHSRGKVSSRDSGGRALRLIGTYLDITGRKADEARIAKSEQLLARMSRVSRTGGWDFDLKTGRSTWSDEMYRIRELDPSVEPDRNVVMNAYSPESRVALETAREAAVKYQIPWDMELQMTTAKGNQIWVRSQGEAVLENGVTVALTGTLKNVTWRKQSQIDLNAANAKLERMAMSDGLTGIANRRLFDQTLPVEWMRSARAKTPLSLLMIDIDHFKLYNDHYGHAGGDHCLQQVAAALATCSRRAGDLVSRFGGEEFAILLPGCNMESAAAVAMACVEAVGTAKIVHAASPTSPWVSISVGVATVVARADTPALSLIERADAALYRAKLNGRSRFEVSDETPAATRG